MKFCITVIHFFSFNACFYGGGGAIKINNIIQSAYKNVYELNIIWLSVFCSTDIFIF